MKQCILLFCLFIALSGHGQDSTSLQLDAVVNPFQIEGRKAQISEIEKNTVQEAQANNPFEVTHIPLRKNQIQNSTEISDNSDHLLVHHFPLVTILGLLILLAVILTRKRDLIPGVFSAAFRDYALIDFMKEEQGGRSINLILTHGFALLAAAFFLTLILKSSLALNPWLLFGYLSLGLVGWYIVKFFLLNTLNQIFSVDQEVTYYRFQILLWNILLGIVLFILSVFIAYSPESIANKLVYLALGFGVLLWLMKLGKVGLNTLAVFFRQPFQYFLYLCAFEIAPILMLVRFLQG